MNNPGKPFIQSKLNEKKGSLQSFFSGEVESTRDRLQRQQIVNELNYGLEATFVEKDDEEEALGDIYDFDSFMEKKEETQKKEEKAAIEKKKEKQPSKYIAILKQRADERKRELDIIYEKNRLKERQKEDALYEGKEKFVTAAYKRKLEADRKWLEEVRERELKGRTSKGTFMSNMFNSRANESGPATDESVSGEPSGVSDRDTLTQSKPSKPTQSHVDVEEDDGDDFDGFIMAPEEDQIKGNVSADEDEEEDAGFIMAPKEDKQPRDRSRSRSRSRSRDRHRSRSRSRSRSHGHSRHHHHSHRHHHRRYLNVCYPTIKADNLFTDGTT